MPIFPICAGPRRPISRVHAAVRRRAALAALLFAPVCLLAAARAADAQPAAPPALVLVVRHAEKVDNSADPALSEAGMARARALAAALADAGVQHVIVTPRQRTLLTAQPLMTTLGLEAEVVGFGANMNAHIADLAAAVRRQPGKVVLVVGHSNTVPALVHALGGPKQPDLCETRYASLFAVVPGAPDTPARVVVASVGEADPPGAEVCAGMSPL